MARKAAGYSVAANYGGNDEAASKFKGETGIPVFKFDVGDYDASAAGVKQVESEVGPVDILVNNAGITRDGFFHRMSKEQWSAVIRTNLDSLFNVTRPVIDGMRSRDWGRIFADVSRNRRDVVEGALGAAVENAVITQRRDPIRLIPG